MNAWTSTTLRLSPVEYWRNFLPVSRSSRSTGAQQGHEDPDGGRLAGAVGAEEAEDLALLDLGGDAVDAASSSTPCAITVDRSGCRRLPAHGFEERLLRVEAVVEGSPVHV